MIRLYIDGQEVALKANQGFTYYRHNPFYDKSGDYTYDIDVDLNYKSNRLMYAEYSVINSVASVKKSRRAELWDGAMCVCNGSEVVLSVDKNEAKIQIVAGESEFNYLIGNENKVRDLDLGDLGAFAESDLWLKQNAKYPSEKYAYPSFYTTSAKSSDYWERIGDQYNLFWVLNNEVNSDHGGKWAKCPFLLHVIDKVIEALGYNIVENSLADEDRWQRLVMFNPLAKTSVAEMLPDWTVKKFIEEVENFFNCVIVTRHGEARILNRSSYANANVDVIDGSVVLEEYEVQSSDGDTVFVNSDVNLEYNLPNDIFFKFANIPDENMEQLVVMNAQYLWITPDEEEAQKPIVYHDPNDFYFAIAHYNQGSSDFYFRMMCNQFKGKSGGINMSIVPVQINAEQWSPGEDEYYLCASTSVAEVNDVEMTGEDIIVNGYKEVLTEKIEVAFYAGVKPYYSSEGTPSEYKLFPQAYNQKFNTSQYWDDSRNYIEIDSDYTLELYGNRGRHNSDYKSSLNVDHHTKYVAKFKTKEIKDASCIFLISGRRFMCSSLKYEYKNLELTGIVEGEFYPIIEI